MGTLSPCALSPGDFLTPYRVTCRCGEAAAGIRPRTARGPGVGVAEGMGNREQAAGRMPRVSWRGPDLPFSLRGSGDVAYPSSSPRSPEKVVGCLVLF